MCWTNSILIPIILKKPLRVYKVGTVTSLGSFISLYRDCMYYKCQTMPTVKINPVFIRHHVTIRRLSWWHDNFRIYKGYHSYLTKEAAKHMKSQYEEIGIFEIPAGATIYVNYRRKEVVSTDIKYLGLLKE